MINILVKSGADIQLV